MIPFTALTALLDTTLLDSASEVHLAEDYLAALYARDFDRLRACFAEGVRFRALVPPGVREGANAEEAVGLLRRWFGDAEQIMQLSSSAGMIGDRLHFAYRFHVWKAGAPFLIEQQAYCIVADGRIADLSLLCSGFRPAFTPDLSVS